MNNNLLNSIQNFKIEEYFNTKGIQYTSNDRYFTLDKCANQSCSKHNKMILNKNERYFICFVCGEHGSLIDFISLVDGVSYKQAYDLVCNQKTYIENSLLSSSLSDKNDIQDDYMEEICLPQYFKNINLKDDSDESRYLKNERGFTQELIDLFNVKFDPYQKRIIFPIYNENDILVAYQARDITGKSEIKILTKPNGFKKSLVIYNWNNAKDGDFITITEGPIDCIKSYQMNSIATFGKQISKQQLSLIMKNKNLKRIYIALDPDAKKQINDLALLLSPLYDVKIISLPNNKGDIGECSIDEANEIISSACSYYEWNKIESHIKI